MFQLISNQCFPFDGVSDQKVQNVENPILALSKLHHCKKARMKSWANQTIGKAWFQILTMKKGNIEVVSVWLNIDIDKTDKKLTFLEQGSEVGEM